MNKPNLKTAKLMTSQIRIINRVLQEVEQQGRISPCAEVWIASFVLMTGISQYQSLTKNGMEVAIDRGKPELKRLMVEHREQSSNGGSPSEAQLWC